jgi:tetratricopeptide (TPR) repeat protein
MNTPHSPLDTLIIDPQSKRFEQLASDLHEVHNCLQQGETAPAAQKMERILQQTPPTAWLCNILGGLYRQLGRLDEALSQFHRAIRLEPADPLGYSSLAVILFEMGKGTEAQEVLSKLLTLTPQNLTVLKLLASLYGATGQAEKEVQTHIAILQQYPRDVDSLLFLANFHFRSGNPLLAEQLRGMAMEGTTITTLLPELLQNYVLDHWTKLQPHVLKISAQQEQLLQQANSAIEQKQWDTAQRHYATLLDLPGLNPILHQPLREKIQHLQRLTQLNLKESKYGGEEFKALDEQEEQHGRIHSRPRLISQLCKHADYAQPWFQQICRDLKLSFEHFHRKSWEYCFIAQALKERGMLSPGKKGLGFGVGREQLVALYALRGCSIIATDLGKEEAFKLGWVETNQHSNAVEELFLPGFCDLDQFLQRVEFRNVDMNTIPEDLCQEQFDFTWSACSFEHVGSIARGKQFILNQMKCLRPGGVAVHTTEFNLSSNEFTVDNEPTVLYRRRDIEDIARALQAEGHCVELDFNPGDGALDSYIDIPPYSSHPRSHHLKLLIGRFICTSIGLIIQKKG